MMSQTKRAVFMWSVAGLAMTFAAGADAHAARPKRLRDEVTALKVQIAQLQTQADYQMRLIAASHAAPATGNLCVDPCSVDSDGDGINDCEDLCPCDPNNQDTDGDGVPDCDL